MPQVVPGVYLPPDNVEKAHEAESSYYMDFYIQSALFSMEKLMSSKPEITGDMNKVQYYHYYTDHLLFALGQISNRFVLKKNEKELYKKRKEQNRMNFDFSDEKYPLLSSKRARNVLEHIDERDMDTILEDGSVGGFNLIDIEADEKFVRIISKERIRYLYSLNLQRNEIWLYDRKNDATIDISLEKLEEELQSLSYSVRCFIDMIKSY